MADYDNTNRGAAFTPFPQQQLILQGKVNIDGLDKKVTIVRDQTKDGRVIIEVYEKIGVMFENDKSKNENAPDYSGPMDRPDKKIAAWRKMKDDKPYMSISVTEAQHQSQQISSQPEQRVNINDDIPF